MVNLDTPPESPRIMENDPGPDFEQDSEGEFDFEDAELVEELDGTAEGGEIIDIFDEVEPISPPTDDAKHVFSNHTGSVFSCDIEPKESKIALTGGQDDKAFLWDVDSGNVLLECKNHKDSVDSVCFSHDGMYAATGDLAGNIQVWNVCTKNLVWSTEDSYGDFTWMKWHHAGHILFCGFAAGDVYVFRIPVGDMKVLLGSGENTESGVLMPDGKRLVVGYESGAVKIFDIKSAKIIHHIKAGNPHTSNVISMDSYHDNNLIMTGDAEGTVAFITTQTGKVVSAFDTKELIPPGPLNPNGSEGHITQFSVECIVFYKNPSFPVALSSNNRGYLYIWDISRQALRGQIDIKSGITCIRWKQDKPIVYLACLDGRVRVYDVQNSQEIGQLCGHRNSILDLAVSSDGKTLITASEDRKARVFNVEMI